MFCGFKIEITDLLLYESLHKSLNFIYQHDNQGVVLPWSNGTFKNLKIATHSCGRIIVRGSLHSYWNGGIHNYTDFTILEVEAAINDLCNSLGLNPYTARLSNLEYGVNINTPFNASKFIQSLFCYRFKNFNKWEVGKNAFGRFCEMTQYIIKFYDKGGQFHLVENILRFEKKINKMEVLSKAPLYLIDLLNPKIQAECLTQLLDAFEHVLFDETINRESLTIPQKKNYEAIAIDIANKGLINEDGKARFDAKQRCAIKSQYLNIINQKGLEKYRPTIVNLINEKFSFLTKKGNVLTRYLSSQKQECFDTFSTRSIDTPFKDPTRVCRTCGRDISEQKYNSKYCSELRFGKEAKKCRNDISNPKNNEKNKHNLLKSRGLLFPIEPFFRSKGNLLTPYTRNQMQ